MSGLFNVVCLQSSLKMVAPLSNCTIVERQGVIHVLWSEDIKTSEVYRRMLVQYGEHHIAQKNVYDRLKHRRKILDDDERSGCPSTSRIGDHHADVVTD